MKKIILSLIAAMACMSISAQVIKVYKNDSTTPEETYTNTATDKYKVVFEEAPAAPTDPNLLTGKFTVAEGKQVQFTKSNLYWDGSAWHFEANQTDYDKGTTSEGTTTYTSTHVSHFYWTKTAAASYAADYSDGTNTTTDKFFADGSDADHKLTVDNTEGLYALTSAEWTYLLNTRNVNDITGEGYSYQRTTLTLSDGTTVYGMIIVPDNYSGTPALTTSTSWADWQTMASAGVVFLPAAGNRYGSSLYGGGSNGFYWSATPSEGNENSAYRLYFYDSLVLPATSYFRDLGSSVRLVK